MRCSALVGARDKTAKGLVKGNIVIWAAQKSAFAELIPGGVALWARHFADFFGGLLSSHEVLQEAAEFCKRSLYGDSFLLGTLFAEVSLCLVAVYDLGEMDSCSLVT